MLLLDGWDVDMSETNKDGERWTTRIKKQLRWDSQDKDVGLDVADLHKFVIVAAAFEKGICKRAIEVYVVL